MPEVAKQDNDLPSEREIVPHDAAISLLDTCQDGTVRHRGFVPDRSTRLSDEVSTRRVQGDRRFKELVVVVDRNLKLIENDEHKGYAGRKDDRDKP